MSTHDSDGPSPMPPAYSALLERLALPLTLEAVHSTLARAFDLDAKQHARHPKAAIAPRVRLGEWSIALCSFSRGNG